MGPVTREEFDRFREEVARQLGELRQEIIRSEGRAARKACDRVARRLS